MNETHGVLKTLLTVIVIVLVLGFVIYKYNPTDKVDVSSSVNPTSPVSSMLATTTNNPNQQDHPFATTSSPLDKTLTSDEKSILYVPTKILTPDEEKARFDLISKVAVATDKLVIKDCVANPVILKTKVLSTITVSNEGKNDLHFGFDGKNVLVAPGKNILFKVNFKTGQGIYSYGCDDKSLSRPMGLLWVTL